jgi:dolichyl-phosphate-mannose--protein O-mannosyl transferase
MHDVNDEAGTVAPPEPIPRAFRSWWAWLGVLAVTVLSLTARGFDISGPLAIALTVIALVGAVISVTILGIYSAMRFRSRRGK